MRFDSIPFNRKPNRFEIGGINRRLSIIENKLYSPSEIVSKIESGFQFIADELEGERKDSNFRRTRYILLDFDDEDTDILANEQKLKELGIDFFLRYKSYSYTEQKQKHRYMLKFDEYLNYDEAKSIQYYLADKMSIDQATVGNLGRIWFGTSFKIEDSDKPFNEVNKETILKNVSIRPYKKEFESQAMKSFRFRLTDVDMKVFEEILHTQVDGWVRKEVEYNDIRNGIYSACVQIAIQTSDETFIEAFMDYIPTSKRSEWLTYYKHDMKNHKVSVGRALNIISQFANIVPYDIKNIFDILDDVEFIDIDSNQFINDRLDIRTLERGTNLLVSPSGSGKTTAIIDNALKSEGYRIMVVPTIAIVEQLINKYSKYGDKIEFLVSTTEDGIIRKTGNDNLKLTICTYDAYTFNTFPEHILYIDEAHELISFHSISQKQFVINYVLHNYPKDSTVFVTATPFNLADIFDRKVFFRKETNKTVDIKFTNKMNTTMVNDIVAFEGKKILIYINSKNKCKKLHEHLSENYPYIKTDIISSETRGKAYNQLIETNTTEFDVVITTKFLNIGFDINNVFDVVMYAHKDIKANDLLQFFNRERKSAQFICYTNNETTSYGFNTNTGYNRFSDKLNHLTENDRKLLDNKYVNDELNEHLIVDKMYYSRVRLNVEHIEELFKVFYPNYEQVFNATIETDDLFVDNREKLVTSFERYFESGMIEEDFRTYFMGEQIDWNNRDFPSGCIKRVYSIFNVIKRNFDNLIDNKYLEWDDNQDGVKFIRDWEEYLYISDTYRINKFENEEIKEVLKTVMYSTELSAEDKLNTINKLNMRKIYISNLPWNEKNFTARLSLFGIYFNSKQVRRDGGRESISVNVTNILKGE